MNISNKVDAVIATGDRNDVDEDAVNLLGNDIESMDVAPDPQRRIILLAPTKQEGREYAESLGIEPVAIVTPRSPHASVGMIADEIIEAPDLPAEVVAELMVHAGPSLATTTGASL